MANITPAGRQRHAAGEPSHATGHAALARLEPMTARELRWEWKLKLGKDPPSTRSSHFLRRTLAWKIQESAFGGLDAETRRTLNSVATALERDGDYEPQIRRGPSPGVVLTREWKGVVHRVTVTGAASTTRGAATRAFPTSPAPSPARAGPDPRFFGLGQKMRRRSSDASGTPAAGAVAP
ncbi:MAG: DUF2924 domain-containing protein, partial [Rhizomicrobium sp.]